MSNFFQQQQAARTRTTWLLFLYLSSIVALAASTYLLLLLALSQSGVLELSTVWQPELFLMCTIGTLVLVLSGSVYKFAQLNSGAGAGIAQELGGSLICPDTQDPAQKRLLNVVEEMALAAGIAVPPVYLLSEEAAINAFAAGFSPSQAVIGVTQGTLTQLSRDELQGVIAHEFSHILNGDMRLNLKILAILHGLLLLSLVGRGMLEIAGTSSRRSRYSYRSSSSTSRNEQNPGAALALVGIGLLLLGAIGVFFGRLIKSAVSRQREFLADASAVQFTRNPLGISGALKKIGGLSASARLQHPKAEEASHMFFANGLRSSFAQLLATHPPLIERISRIEGRPYSEAQLAEFAETYSKPSQAGNLHQQAENLAGFSSSTGTDPFQHMGEIPEAALLGAQNILGSLPFALQQAARRPETAQELLLALLRAQSANAPASIESSDDTRDPLHEALSTLPIAHALPLLDLCLPALQQLEEEKRSQFLRRVKESIMRDGSVSLFEYALFWTLLSRLQKQRQSLSAGMGEVDFKKRAALCLGIFAALSAQEPNASALHAACTLLEMPAEFPKEKTKTELLARFEALLLELRNALPLQKQKLCAACTTLVRHDKVTTEQELLVLRALHAALDCPVPLAG